MVKQWDEPEPDWVTLAVFALALEKAGGTDCTGAQRLLATDGALRILATDRNGLETTAMLNRTLAVPTSLSGLDIGLGPLYSVDVGEVAIYARPGSLANPFQRVGRDVWRSLRINPQDGSAVAADGTQFFSIHVKEVAPSAQQATAPARKRGLKSFKLDQTKEAMRAKIRADPEYRKLLEREKEKVLAFEFNVSRDTARKARNAVLSEFVEKSNRDK